MKEYRNSIRSRIMIKNALIELLKEEDISKITVKKVVDRADLSRNTFYAHYDDVYAIIEEIQTEIIDKCMNYLNDIIKDFDVSKALSFFQNVLGFVDNNKDTIKILISNDFSGQFLEKLKSLLISRVINSISPRIIKDSNGFMIFLDILFSGVIDLLRLYLNNRVAMTLNDVAIEINKIFLAGYKLYI